MIQMLKVFVVTVAIFSAGCSEETPKLYGKKGIQAKNIDVNFEREDLNPAVDILFIVDDSGSMGIHQRNISKNINQFLLAFEKNTDIDYHIGVITTDNDSTAKSGKLQGGPPHFITRKTSNGLDLLRQRLQVGTWGSGSEAIFDPVVNAVTPPLSTGFNKDFFRPKAYFALIMITDAEEQSNQWTGPDFHNYLVNLKNGDQNKVVYYAAYVPTSENCPTEENAARLLENFFSLVKAKTFSLCDPDFGSKLAGVGADLVKRVNRRILLDTRPVISTIEITFGTQVIPPSETDGWMYNIEDNSLIFGKYLVWTEQPAGTTVKVNYLPVE